MDALFVLIGIALTASTTLMRQLLQELSHPGLHYLQVPFTSASKGSCYQFKGNGRVSYAYNEDISTDAHFSLKFKTKDKAGVLYYAGGTYNQKRVFDYEGLYIDEGILYYFLYNPGEYSMGSSSGFFGASKTEVNDGDWHTAEFLRNVKLEKVHEDGSRTLEYQTALKLDGEEQAVDSRKKDGISIFQPISLGRDPHEIDRSNPFPGFKGSIREFKDVLREKFLTEGSIDGPVAHCIGEADTQ